MARQIGSWYETLRDESTTLPKVFRVVFRCTRADENVTESRPKNSVQIFGPYATKAAAAAIAKTKKPSTGGFYGYATVEAEVQETVADWKAIA